MGGEPVTCSDNAFKAMGQMLFAASVDSVIVPAGSTIVVVPMPSTHGPDVVSTFAASTTVDSTEVSVGDRRLSNNGSASSTSSATSVASVAVSV